MIALTRVLLGKYRLAVVAVITAIPFIFFFGWPTVAHAAGVDDETQFVFNTFSFLVWGALGDVDVRRFHHARVRCGANEERVDDLP